MNRWMDRWIGWIGWIGLLIWMDGWMVGCRWLRVCIPWQYFGAFEFFSASFWNSALSLREFYCEFPTGEDYSTFWIWVGEYLPPFPGRCLCWYQRWPKSQFQLNSQRWTNLRLLIFKPHVVQCRSLFSLTGSQTRPPMSFCGPSLSWQTFSS